MFICLLGGSWGIFSNATGLRFKKSILVQALSGCSQYRNILTLLLYRVAHFLLMWCFYSQRLLKLLDSGKCWLCQAICHGDCLLHQSWVICTNTCGIEFWIKLLHTTLISYRSSSAVQYFLILEVDETLRWLFIDQVFSCANYLTLPEFAQTCVGLSFKTSFIIQSWSDISHPKQYSGLNC